jgi:hypothetical protein
VQELISLQRYATFVIVAGMTVICLILGALGVHTGSHLWRADLDWHS